MLYKKGVAEKALKKKKLLESVVRNSRLNCTDSNDSATYVAYEDLLQHKIRIAPSSSNVPELRQDYNSMRENGMFFGEAPSFDEIMDQLKILESILNTLKT